MTQNHSQTVPAAASATPDTRTPIEKKLDAANGVTRADVLAAAATQNFAEDFSPSATLAALMAADDAPTQKIAPVEAGVALSDGALRVLALAQGTTALTDAERERLDAAEHRADLDRALALAQDNAERLENIRSTATPIDAADVLRRFLSGERDFTDAEAHAMKAAIETAQDDALGFDVTLSAEKSADLERIRRSKIRELAPAIAALQRGQQIDHATSARLSRINLNRILRLLREGAHLRDLPLDLVRNF
ncbi:hypothetical protein ACVU7I_01805 [Patulibacter sp. S7RM1-6]